MQKGIRIMEINSVGTIRRMDDLGRVVIPKEHRLAIGMTRSEWEVAPAFEVFTVEDGFYLKRRKDLDSE